jgi:hypothetical protein
MKCTISPQRIYRLSHSVSWGLRRFSIGTLDVREHLEKKTQCDFRKTSFNHVHVRSEKRFGGLLSPEMVLLKRILYSFDIRLRRSSFYRGYLRQLV